MEHDRTGHPRDSKLSPFQNGATTNRLGLFRNAPYGPAPLTFFGWAMDILCAPSGCAGGNPGLSDFNVRPSGCGTNCSVRPIHRVTALLKITNEIIN